jgi:type IV pilus assembly protein PilC
MLSSKPSLQEFSIFNLELANLVRCGLPLPEGLKNIAKEMKNPLFRKEIEKIGERMQQGQSLSQALEQSKINTSPYYLALVRAGERAGSLTEVLKRIIQHTRFRARAAQKIKSAASYPFVVLAVAYYIFLMIFIVIVPKFAELYSVAGARLPGLTRLILNISHFFGAIGWVFSILLFPLIVLGMYVLLGWVLPFFGGYIQLWIPLVGRLLKKSLLAHFCEVVGYLLRHQVPLPEALRMAAMTSGNAYVVQTIEATARQVERGRPLSESMKETGFYPRSLVWMVETAEKQEQVGEVLEESAAMYRDMVDDWSERVYWLLQPFLLFMIGGLIFLVVVALYLPLFRIGSVIR